MSSDWAEERKERLRKASALHAEALRLEGEARLLTLLLSEGAIKPLAEEEPDKDG